MSKFAIMTKITPGPWTEDGEVTLNVDLIAAIEAEPGCGARFSRLTLSGGRELCVRGKPESIRRAVVRQATQVVRREPSIFERVFGPSQRGGIW